LGWRLSGLFRLRGWQHASYLAGEARDPRRTVPRAMIIGAVVVGTVYWLANLAYMLLLPVEKIAASSCPPPMPSRPSCRLAGYSSPS